MQEPVYKKIEVVGSSEKSIDDAVRNAIGKAGETVKNLRWFEVSEIRGNIEDGVVSHFQATVKLGFRLQDEG